MPKRMNVGASMEHTPIKQAIVREFVSKEVRCANFIPRFHGMKWLDLTAGNGIPFYDAPWTEACSPGILASRAVLARKPIRVDLYEKNPDTFALLLESLAENLPGLGYERTADERIWTAQLRNSRGEVVLRAGNFNSRDTAWVDDVDKHDAVIVLNDPNSVTEWAMSEKLTGRLEALAAGLRTLSCVGFNVGGGKRAPFERDEMAPRTDSISARSDWYGLVKTITWHLPKHMDLMLAGFKRDSAQWAYLFSAPQKWRSEEEAVIAQAFKEAGQPRDYEFAWYRQNREQFMRLVDRRILTQAELDSREKPMLPFGPREEEGAA